MIYDKIISVDITDNINIFTSIFHCHSDVYQYMVWYCGKVPYLHKAHTYLTKSNISIQDKEKHCKSQEYSIYTNSKIISDDNTDYINLCTYLYT